MKTLKLTAAKPTEAEIQRACIRRLQAHGWVTVRVNSGGFKNHATGSYLRAYTICGLEKSAGFPDLVAFNSDGRFLLIECKDDKGKLSDAQKLFHDYAAQRGVPVYVLRSPEELTDLI